MAAGPTMERLAYTSLGSDANGITFTSISQSYTTLYVTGHLKSDATSDSGLYFTINDNSGNVYSMMGWYGASSRSYATSQSNYVDRFGMDANLVNQATQVGLAVYLEAIAPSQV